MHKLITSNQVEEGWPGFPCRLFMGLVFSLISVMVFGFHVRGKGGVLGVLDCFVRGGWVDNL